MYFRQTQTHRRVRGVSLKHLILLRSSGSPYTDRASAYNLWQIVSSSLPAKHLLLIMEKGEREAGSRTNPKRSESNKSKKRRRDKEKTSAKVDRSTNHSNVTATTSGTGERTVAGDPSDQGNKRPRGDGAGAAAASLAGKKRPRESVAAPHHHPFPTEYGDHFETPLQAYRDIEGALALLAKLLDKKRKHLRIWDPYVSPSQHVDSLRARGSVSVTINAAQQGDIRPHLHESVWKEPAVNLIFIP